VRFHTLDLSVRGHLGEIRLDCAPRRNPIDAEFVAELDRAAAQLHDSGTVRVVILSAAGDVFSSGIEFAGRLDEVFPAGSLPFRCLELMAQPVIACIQGDAIGAGLELALACDLRVAAGHAMFALPDVTMGTMVSGGATQRLPRLIGRARAAEMILLGRPIDAPTAAAYGLVNHVAPAADARAEVERLAAAIAARGPLAVRYAKEAMLRGADMPLDQALRYETDLTVILQTTDDRAEGVDAFLQKRDAHFEGR